MDKKKNIYEFTKKVTNKALIEKLNVIVLVIGKVFKKEEFIKILKILGLNEHRNE